MRHGNPRWGGQLFFFNSVLNFYYAVLVVIGLVGHCCKPSRLTYHYNYNYQYTLVGGVVAQWLERRSLTGEFSLIYA